MFRGNERGLPVDTVDGEDPRPDPEISYAPGEALTLASNLGYEGFEKFDWRTADESAAYEMAMRTHGLEALSITANKGGRAPGCGLTEPSEREGFLAEIADASAAATDFGCQRLVVLTGFEREGAREQNKRTAACRACVKQYRSLRRQA